MEYYGLLESVLQALVAGLLVGALYGLMSVGVGVIFGVMQVVNFAQGEFLMLGMYASLYMLGAAGGSLLIGSSLSPFLTAVLAGPVLFGIGYLVHRFLLARLTGIRVAGIDGAGHYGQLILTLGLSLVLQNGGLMLFGSTPQSVRTPLSSHAWELDVIGEDVVVFINQARSVAFIVSIIIAALLFRFINRSRTGKALKAASDNAEAAIYMGIDVDRAHRLAFGIGAAVTGIAGGLVASYNSFQPYIGVQFVIVMYAGVVLGGMGSILGAFWGGMLIGLVQELSVLILPVQLQSAAIFVFFLLVVQLLPQGLFGRVSERT